MFSPPTIPLNNRSAQKSKGSDSSVLANGPVLRFANVTRHDMGFYMCIASNGIAPSVSQRVFLPVSCKCCYLNLLVSNCCDITINPIAHLGASTVIAEPVDEQSSSVAMTDTSSESPAGDSGSASTRAQVEAEQQTLRQTQPPVVALGSTSSRPQSTERWMTARFSGGGNGKSGRIATSASSASAPLSSWSLSRCLVASCCAILGASRLVALTTRRQDAIEVLTQNVHLIY